jgi:WD40 repeat protein
MAIPRAAASEQHGPLAFSPGNDILAVADPRYQITLYRLASGRPRLLARLESPDRKPLTALTFSPDGGRLAAVAKDHGIQIWNLRLVCEQLANFDLQEDWPEYKTSIRYEHRKPEQ